VLSCRNAFPYRVNAKALLSLRSGPVTRERKERSNDATVMAKSLMQGTW
jgi:hypothetical protein